MNLNPLFEIVLEFAWLLESGERSGLNADSAVQLQEHIAHQLQLLDRPTRAALLQFARARAVQPDRGAQEREFLREFGEHFGVTGD